MLSTQAHYSSATYDAFICNTCNGQVSSVELCRTCGCEVCPACILRKGQRIKENGRSIRVNVSECFPCWVERRGGAKPDRHGTR